uniref:1-Cys peroxiredoxin n=1 Tax=Culicoides sonorensis TaxID=179676 RepID=A0A336MVD7_CULSO
MRLGVTIPNFEADSTKGRINFYEWLGESWCVLFSHPADFTPVCTTELGRIAVHAPEFKKRNVKILAHSADELQSHVDWVNDIKSYCQDICGDFPFPIIADPKRDLAVKLEMIDEAQSSNPEIAKTVRALFIISPDKKLRLSMHYPVSTGRNVDEILRCIDSLQLCDSMNGIIATPANWTPGTKVMVLPTVSDEEIKKHFPQGLDAVNMPSNKVYIRTTENY